MCAAMLRSCLLLCFALMAASPAARAEALPPPLEFAPPTAQPADNPGFAMDVEHALDDLTRLQCGLLGLILINSQPCPVP
jgi:hypothetical protein